VVVHLLQEHDLAERALRRGKKEKATMETSGGDAGEAFGAQRGVVAGRTCASVAFWNASKIFFSATVSRVFLSTAFHTMPYACAER
jgi:hypothetical protein